jgi:hypothetical protein
MAGPVQVTSGGVYLVFSESDGETYACLVDRAETLEVGMDDDVTLAIYELNISGQLRQVRVESAPFIRANSEWNVVT